MNEERFIKGRCYFLFGYYDHNCRFPYIQTFVYLGKNLDVRISGDHWYFQNPQYFEKQKDIDLSRLEQSGILLTEANGLEGFVDYDGLIQMLKIKL